ncbi:MAG: (R)-specific enoyl-CoA hydratase [Betaproteobacteria bacterium ADurb.Bin341]|nr:MAG: (R)-specific enoyl-CoA hydratase [Betaproteobacteria bacterium ADurb.Bin341]
MNFNVGDTASFRRILTQEDFNRFAALSWDDNPIHCDPVFAAKSHFGGTVSHGMLLYSVLSKGLSELIPGPGAIQLEQEMMHPNGTYTGEECVWTITVKAVNPDGTLELTTVISKASDPANIKHQGRARVAPYGVKPEFTNTPATPAIQQEGDDYLYGLRPGMFKEKKRIFSAADLAEYGNLSGDRNPIFREKEFAQDAGFKEVIVPWPLLAGMFSDMLGTDLPGRGTGWMKQKLIYKSAAYPGEELTARVEIIRLRADKELVNLRSTIVGADGRLICDGESLVLVRNLENKDDKSAQFPLAA